MDIQAIKLLFLFYFYLNSTNICKSRQIVNLQIVTQQKECVTSTAKVKYPRVKNSLIAEEISTLSARGGGGGKLYIRIYFNFK